MLEKRVKSECYYFHGSKWAEYLSSFVFTLSNVDDVTYLYFYYTYYYAYYSAYYYAYYYTYDEYYCYYCYYFMLCALVTNGSQFILNKIVSSSTLSLTCTFITPTFVSNIGWLKILFFVLLNLFFFNKTDSVHLLKHLLLIFY